MERLLQMRVMVMDEWKLPLNVAIGLHILVLLGALYLPEIFKAKPRFADIYTVSIINIAEPLPDSPPVPTKKPQVPKVKPQKQPKPEAKKITPIAPLKAESSPKVDPGPAKPISLKPLKRKKIQKIKKATTPPDRNFEKRRRQKLAEALREEELLAEQARLAKEALEAERRLLESQETPDIAQPAEAAPEQQARTTSQTSASSSSLVESRYMAAIINRLQQFWARPDYLQQNPDLTTLVVITIRESGKISRIRFENKSGDRVFDQFVSKAIDAADPMPPIPAALKKKNFEVGLRFTPGSIK